MSTFPMSSPSGEERPRANVRGPFLPLLLLVVAFLGWTIFQTTELIRDRSNLSQAWSQQTQALVQARKLRAATDSLASKTQQLADAGNPNAQLVMSQLRQRGISVNPNASTPPPP
jgi:hypothetical protein